MRIQDLLEEPSPTVLSDKVAFDDYQLIPALRSGVIKDGIFQDASKAIVVSPRHIRASYEGEITKASESMLFGQALHCLLLEPPEFEKRFAYFEGRRDARTKDYREFLEDNEGKAILKKSGPMSWDWCMDAAIELCNNPVVQPYIAEGAREVTGRAPIMDIPCKVRFDWISASSGVLMDVKTTTSVGPLEFWYAFKRYGYGLQLALYRHVYGLITGAKLPVVICAVENAPPFCSIIYEVPEELLDRDLQIVLRVVSTVKDCLAKDEWPSFGKEPLPLNIPDYELETVDVVDWGE